MRLVVYWVKDKNWRGLMSYKVNDQRKQTMLQRLGDAVELIDDQRYLPFYRSIQIKLEKMGKPEEWNKNDWKPPKLMALINLRCISPNYASVSRGYLPLC